MKIAQPFADTDTDDLDSATTVVMQLDEESNHILMDVLSKLYAQPAKAVLREILSNALDASEGVTNKPVEVHLPGTKNILTVRDYGPGISLEQFKTTLSRYGASTRRETNQLRGGYGFGLKSGYAVSDSFKVVSYQNGNAQEVNFRKNKNNLAYLDFSAPYQTTEPDGVEFSIQIPKSNLNEITWTNLVNEHFTDGYQSSKVTFFTDETRHPLKTVNVREDPQVVQVELLDDVLGWVTTFKDRTKTVRTKMFAVVGDVTYSLMGLDTLAPDFKDYGKCIHLNIPIGSVDIPANRETLTYSARTISTLKAALADFRETLFSEYQNQLNKLSRQETLKACDTHRLMKYMDVDKLTWRGESIPTVKNMNQLMVFRKAHSDSTLEKLPSNYTLSISALFSGAKHHRKTARYIISTDDYKNVVKKVSSLVNSFARVRYAEDFYGVLDVVVVSNDNPHRNWIPEGKEISFDDFKAEVNKYKAEVRAKHEAEKEERANAQEHQMVDMSKMNFNSFTYIAMKKNPADYAGRVKLYISVGMLKDMYYRELKPRSNNGTGVLSPSKLSLWYSISKLIPDVLIFFVSEDVLLEKFTQQNPDVHSFLDYCTNLIKNEWKNHQEGQTSQIIELIRSVDAKNSRSKTFYLPHWVSTFTNLYEAVKVSENPEDVLPADILEVVKLKKTASEVPSDMHKLISMLLRENEIVEIAEQNRHLSGLESKYPLVAYPMYGKDLAQVKDALVEYVNQQNRKELT